VYKTFGVEIGKGATKLGSPANYWNNSILSKVDVERAEDAVLGEDVVFRSRKLADDVRM
jgi:hypothetical protein